MFCCNIVRVFDCFKTLESFPLQQRILLVVIHVPQTNKYSLKFASVTLRKFAVSLKKTRKLNLRNERN